MEPYLLLEQPVAERGRRATRVAEAKNRDHFWQRGGVQKRTGDGSYNPVWQWMGVAGKRWRQASGDKDG